MPCEKYDVEELVELLKVRNPDAVETFYNTYSPMFYGSIYRLIPDKSAAEEILIKSFLSIFRQVRDYIPSQSFFCWMYAIVFKEVLLWHERKVNS